MTTFSTTKYVDCWYNGFLLLICIFYRSKSSRRSEDNSTNKQSTSKLPTSKSDSKSKHTTESSTSRKHDRPDKKQNDKCKTNDNRSRSDADKVKTVGDKHRSSRDRSSHTKTSKDAKLAGISIFFFKIIMRFLPNLHSEFSS